MIQDQINPLSRAEARLSAAPAVHAAALQILIDQGQASLTTIKAEIDANTADFAALKTDCATIPALRILALRIPQINLVMALDKLNTALPTLDQMVIDLGDAVEAATAAGDPDAAELPRR